MQTLFSSHHHLLLFTVSVQPAKLYYITLLVNNTEPEEVLLAASDSQPASGFILKGKTCNRIVKKLRSPSPVKFRVWGISTDKRFLVNDEKTISIVPSDFEQDVSDVSIRMVKPGGEFVIWLFICCILHALGCRCKTLKLLLVFMLCQGDSNLL